MIPQGPIYYRIRADVLAAFPDKCKAAVKNRNTFAEWLLNGTASYQVQIINSNEVIFLASVFDISSALLTDVECLFNHCFEHLQEISRFYVDDQPRGDAWNVVTIYYFSFFTAQSFLRLIGSPVIFVGQEHMKQIKSLGGISSGGPGAGAYYMMYPAI